MSHCLACEQNTKVEVELENGNYDEAITLAQDLITKKITCVHIPFATFSELAYHLNKVGDSRAQKFFNNALEELDTIHENDSSILSTISLLINYLINNNIDMAFALYEKYSPWELNAEDSLKFTFSKNVINLFKDKGKRKLQMDLKHPLYNDSNLYPLETLYN